MGKGNDGQGSGIRGQAGERIMEKGWGEGEKRGSGDGESGAGKAQSWKLKARVRGLGSRD